jgi:catechol 2,3-dioxygenase-like lactoylglutathione lyase family enzyme
MEFGQLHHLEYYVRDLALSNHFWGWFLPFFGYQEYQQWENGISWRHGNGTYIVFVQIGSEVSKIENNRQGPGLNHLAFVGKDLENFTQLQKELIRRQTKILELDEKYLCVEDPNGFAVEVFIP